MGYKISAIVLFVSGLLLFSQGILLLNDVNFGASLIVIVFSTPFLVASFIFALVGIIKFVMSIRSAETQKTEKLQSLAMWTAIGLFSSVILSVVVKVQEAIEETKTAQEYYSPDGLYIFLAVAWVVSMIVALVLYLKQKRSNLKR